MSEISKIAIVGSGAMGTLLGASLAKQGISAFMVDSNPIVVDSINQYGLVVTGTRKISVPAVSCLTKDLQGKFDLIILLTKQTENDSVLPEILPHLENDGVLLTMQNGCPEGGAAKVFGVERTMGCAVTWAATSIGPGAAYSTAGEDGWHNVLGRTDGKITRQVQEVYELLSKVCATTISTNLTGMRWSKLLINSSFSGVSAVLGCTFGDILKNDAALRIAQFVAKECIDTARLNGIKMEPLAEGEFLDRVMYFRDDPERKKTDHIYHKLFSRTAGGKSSMLQDLERGNKTEIDYINGEICRAAERVNLKVPYCAKVIEIVKLIERGKLFSGMDNLWLFPG